MKRLSPLFLAVLAALIFAAPAAAFTLTVTPAEATGGQTMHLSATNLPNNNTGESEVVEVKLRDAYAGCGSEPSGWSAGLGTFAAPDERGFFVLCGDLWAYVPYAKCTPSTCWIVEEAETTFNVTASSGELKEAKEAKEAEEAEAKAAKEAQAKREREATEAKVAAEAKEAQERTARVEAETKAHEVQRAEREAIERVILNPPTIAPLPTTKTTVTPTSTHPLVQALTPAQKRAKAVANCKKRYKHNKRKRVKCERAARKSHR